MKFWFTLRPALCATPTEQENTTAANSTDSEQPDKRNITEKLHAGEALLFIAPHSALDSYSVLEKCKLCAKSSELRHLLRKPVTPMQISLRSHAVLISTFVVSLSREHNAFNSYIQIQLLNLSRPV